MKILISVLALFISVLVHSQKVAINPVKNSVRMGPMTGNANLTMGVKNIIQEVL